MVIAANKTFMLLPIISTGSCRTRRLAKIRSQPGFLIAVILPIDPPDFRR
jgi:hypothetical protein